MKSGMLACCVVMFLPIAVYFAAGGTLAGVTGNLAAFAPLLLCAGTHLLMFKLMGKSCHGTAKNTGANLIVERPTDIPSVGKKVRAISSH